MEPHWQESEYNRMPVLLLRDGKPAYSRQELGWEPPAPVFVPEVVGFAVETQL